MTGHDANWFENDAFWEAMYPLMFPEPTFAAAAENVPKIAALTGITSGAVLDLACGPGRYAVPLAAAGYRVTGVDRTRWLLDRARERAAAAGMSIEWLEQDMRAPLAAGAFDLVINVFTSFGYFEEAEENRRVLVNVLAALRPGGVLVLEHIGKELLAAKYQPTRSEELADGTVLFHRTAIIDDWSRVDSQWTLVEGERATTFGLRHWLYSGAEMRALLAEVGFAEVSLYGDFEASPYGPGAQRLVAVARKAL